jgi:tRNA dimethylallyltransferase
VKALLEGFDDIPEIPEEVRKGIIENYKENGLSWLQQQVKTLDPEYFERIDNQNPMRLMRALEVRTATGKSISFFQQKAMRVLPFTVVKIGLELSRYELYERIDKRMDAMISKGLFEEAESLYPFRSVTALQTVGYQEVFDFMEGKYNKEEAVRLLKQNSRRYAKRQFTWFKRDAEMVWFHPNAINQMIEMVNTKG